MASLSWGMSSWTTWKFLVWTTRWLPEGVVGGRSTLATMLWSTCQWQPRTLTDGPNSLPSPWQQLTLWRLQICKGMAIWWKLYHYTADTYPDPSDMLTLTLTNGKLSQWHLLLSWKYNNSGSGRVGKCFIFYFSLRLLTRSSRLSIMDSRHYYISISFVLW